MPEKNAFSFCLRVFCSWNVEEHGGCWFSWGFPLELLRGLLTQRTAPSMPRRRGTFRKTRTRKWTLPSRGLWGTQGQEVRCPQALSSQLSWSLGSNNLHEGQPGTPGYNCFHPPDSPSSCLPVLTLAALLGRKGPVSSSEGEELRT